MDNRTTHLRIRTNHGASFRRFGYKFSPSEAKLIDVEDLEPKQVEYLLRLPRMFPGNRRGELIEEKILLNVEEVCITDDGLLAVVSDPKSRKVAAMRSEKQAKEEAEKAERAKKKERREARMAAARAAKAAKSDKADSKGKR